MSNVVEQAKNAGAEKNVYGYVHNALYTAVMDEDIEALKSLIAANDIKREAMPALLFMTTIEFSNINTQTTMVDMLLKAGADPNIKTFGGQTALMFALQLRLYDIAQMLINAGANVDEMNNDLETALNISIQRRDICAITMLIDAGADVNAKNIKNFTPLLGAILDNSSKSVELLLQAGADPNVIYEDGWTALTYAVSNNIFPNINANIVNSLLKAGAKVNIKSALIAQTIANPRERATICKMLFAAAPIKMLCCKAINCLCGQTSYRENCKENC
jgi:ankyrin repeat protein